MVGSVDDDEFGASLIAGLRRDGIDVSAVETRPDVTTGVACVLVETDTGQNRILVSPNANYTLKPDHFKEWSDPVTSADRPSAGDPSRDRSTGAADRQTAWHQCRSESCSGHSLAR